MIQIFKKLREWLATDQIKPHSSQDQINHIGHWAENIEKIIEQEEQEEQEEEELHLVPNTSGSIRIEFDAETGDFGVLASVEDTSDTCVKILSLLMVHMATGDITPFVYESLVGWADKDEEKLDFNERLGLEIIALTTELSEEKKKTERTAAIKASEVFGLRGLKDK